MVPPNQQFPYSPYLNQPPYLPQQPLGIHQGYNQINNDGEQNQKGKDPYYPFAYPWVKPPYEPFKYYGGHEENVPVYVNKDLDQIDLGPYLSNLTGKKKQSLKYPVEFQFEEDQQQESSSND